MHDHGHSYRGGIFTDMHGLMSDDTNSEAVSVDVVVTFDGFTQSPNVGIRVNGDPIEVIGRDKNAVPPRTA